MKPKADMMDWNMDALRIEEERVIRLLVVGMKFQHAGMGGDKVGIGLKGLRAVLEKIRAKQAMLRDLTRFKS